MAQSTSIAPTPQSGPLKKGFAAAATCFTRLPNFHNNTKVTSKQSHPSNIKAVAAHQTSAWYRGDQCIVSFGVLFKNHAMTSLPASESCCTTTPRSSRSSSTNTPGHQGNHLAVSPACLTRINQKDFSKFIKNFWCQPASRPSYLNTIAISSYYLVAFQHQA